MVAITMQRGSYKQLQVDSPVFMLSGGKSLCIGIKQPPKLLDNSAMRVLLDSGNTLHLNKAAARCCFGFYEVINEQLETSLAW